MSAADLVGVLGVMLVTVTLPLLWLIYCVAILGRQLAEWELAQIDAPAKEDK